MNYGTVDPENNSHSSVTYLKAAQSRYNHLKCRQLKRRGIILQHLSKEYPPPSESLIGHSHITFNMQRVVSLRNLFFKDEEDVFRKRTVLPVISRLKGPVLSDKLISLVQSIFLKPNINNRLNQHTQAQKWDKFSLEVVGDKLRQTLSSTTTNSHHHDDDDDDDDDNVVCNQDCDKFPTNFSLASQFTEESCDTDDLIINTYTGSAAFLKGTQSANPHNDYCQHFVDTGARPQNFIRDTGLKNRFEEYPKLRELIRLKDQLIQSRATAPMYLRTDLRTFDLNELQCKFDAILIEPPLEEYHRMNGAVFDQYWTWDEIENLAIDQITAPRAFVWIWCGSGEGLDAARKCLRKWGFRRCEDICWIKTNTSNPGHAALEPGAVFQRTKEHCLMGIHGTVRRSTDGDFIHANIDIDLIIEEAPQHGGYAAKDKPTEIFHIIEHFCLGRRRLHLFGRDSTLRPGWLTVGNELSASNFDARIYANNFNKEPNGLLLGSTEEIERLRPKSPPPRHPSTTNVTTQNPICSLTDIVGTAVCPNSSLNSGLSTHSVYTVPITCSIGNPGSPVISGSNLGHPARRFPSTSNVKLLNSNCTQQPSLLGLPNPSQNLNNRGITSVQESLRLSNNFHNSLMTNPPSTRALAALQAAAATHQTLMSAGGPSLWPVHNNLALALAAASYNLSSTSSLSQTNARSQLTNAPLIASLMAGGKFNPALLSLLNSNTPSGTTPLSLLNNLMRSNANANKHPHHSWH